MENKGPYTDAFRHASDSLILVEGGKTKDHAGWTNWGITLRSLRETGDLSFDMDRNGILDKQDLWLLPREKAVLYIHNYWWSLHGLHRLHDEQLASKVLDVFYNMGPRTGTKLLQRAANACGRSLRVDGGFGPLTVASVNATEPTVLLDALRKQQRAFYLMLIRRNPSRFRKFRKGWLRRAAL